MSALSDAIPNRVRALRAERGWSLAKLAEAAGTTPSQIQKLEKSQRRLTFEWVGRLAKAFGITEQDLMGTARQAQAAAVRMVPLIGAIAAGNWREAVEHRSLGEVAGVGASETAFALQAEGTSMDKLIPDGGYVIVEPDMIELRDGKIYAVMNEEGETTVKRFRGDPARLEPCSTDLAHQTINLGQLPFRVVGRVTGAYTPL